ncbi:MAG: vitamin B12 dependent-methionine synthase activation domain-containing protein [Candidatus Eisenbacteria bacterium]
MQKRIIEIAPSDIEPSEAALLRAMGVPADRAPGERVLEVLSRALDEFRDRARPVGMFAETDADAFTRVYEGDGDNEVPSPLRAVFPGAERLALFAATVGADVSERIPALFDEGQLALGAALDAAASEATELAGMYLDRAALEDARGEGVAGAGTRLLRYSPGYCGWNITGQRALFAALEPGEIGISLNASCLMEPLKSISGVMVMGPAAIHDFPSDFGFCEDCRTKDCRARIRAMRDDPPGVC